MNFLTLATDINWIGSLIYNNLYLGWVSKWASPTALIGSFAITVILFTLFLKTATLPLDLWQKSMGRKNQKKMEIMKPELDRLQKQYGSDRQVLMVKQREIYKKHKYSAFSACLPTIVTLVIFIVIFSGFNSAVRFHNSTVLDNLIEGYDKTYAETVQLNLDNAEMTDAQKEAAAYAASEKWVLDNYQPQGFLLTKNIFMPDTWKKPVPTIDDFHKGGMGGLNIPINEANKTTEAAVLDVLAKEYNNDWNGYLILPILAFALSILSTKLVKAPEQPAMPGQTEEQIKASKTQQKIMMYMMPLIFGVFTLFYSTAFTLYMVVSNLFTTLFNLGYNIITKRIDAKEKDIMMSTTIKR